MGGVASRCSIDDSPILKTADWDLHHAQNEDNTAMSVFISCNNTPQSKLNALGI